MRGYGSGKTGSLPGTTGIASDAMLGRWVSEDVYAMVRVIVVRIKFGDKRYSGKEIAHDDSR